MGLLQMIWRAFVAWLVMKLMEWTGMEPTYETDNHTGEHRVKYPESYTQNHFSDGPDNYRWRPVYKAPVNQLYNNEAAVHYRKRFKYMDEMNGYET